MADFGSSPSGAKARPYFWAHHFAPMREKYTAEVDNSFCNESSIHKPECTAVIFHSVAYFKLLKNPD